MLYVLAQEPNLSEEWIYQIKTRVLSEYLSLEDWHFQNLRQDIFV